MILRWVSDAQISEVMPPECSNDRAFDNWIPLFSIAEQLSEEWREKVLTAYNKIIDAEDEASITTQILGDIREVFDDMGNQIIE